MNMILIQPAQQHSAFTYSLQMIFSCSQKVKKRANFHEYARDFISQEGEGKHAYRFCFSLLPRKKNA